MWENPIRCICVQNFKSISWKMTNLWHFEGRKWPFFTLFPGISTFLRFSNFVRFRPFKKCSRVIFRVLDEKLTQKHVSRRQNQKFSVWPFPDLVTLNDLDLEYAQRKLIVILRSVPDTIHGVVLTYFNIIRLWCATKPDTPNHPTFWLWSDVWRHQWLFGQQH